jgi:peptidoglycan hydrolase-like protein with peptidoglycan-binding domain
MNFRLPLSAVVATALIALTPAVASAHAPGGGGRAPAKISIKVNGLSGGRAKVGDKVEAVATVTPFVPHQKVELRIGKGGDTVAKSTPYVHQVKGKKFGRVQLSSKALLEPGKYVARITKAPTGQQAGGTAHSKKFSLKYVDLDPGDRGPAVKLFNDLLKDEGYYDTDGHTYGSHTERAVLAFRKVNGMERIFNANPTIFKMLAEGKGAFQPKYGGSGKHVEVDISKQVMALVNDGKAEYVFHVSTGAAATPSDQGGYTFYRKDPGYNSEGMYYSVYYNRGEATHGYASVPPYPASHGCIRNPIPDSIFIYNWINLGDKMYVYV